MYASAPAQVLLRWATQQGMLVVPKSNSKERLIENLKVLEGSDLTSEDMKALSGLNINLRVSSTRSISRSLQSDLSLSS